MAEAADYDSPWKEILERYFEAFFEFFFPEVHADIDWSRGYQFLDKELQKVSREAVVGRRHVDKLARVWRKDGRERWVVVHVEVQGEPEHEFPQRMYRYNYRLYDRYDHEVASFAVLADSQRDWRPDGFGYDLWGCRVGIIFPVVKLLDYESRWDELEASTNPFAVVVMAHLKAQATRRDPEGRLHWKTSLFRRLFEKGYSRKDIVGLFRFMDWVMVLPEELEQRFEDAVEEIEREYGMPPYVTSIERLGIRKGFEQGMEKGLEKGLEKGTERGALQEAREAVIDNLVSRFAPVSDDLIQEIRRLEDLDRLRDLRKRALNVASMEEFRQAVGA